MPPGNSFNILRRLEAELENACESGIRGFYNGGAPGFDLLAAEAVIKFKATFPDVELHLAIPHRRFAEQMTARDRERLSRAVSQADSVWYAGDSYVPGCMDARNHYMADRSELLICYMTKLSGGTFNTVRYSLARGLRIINIAIN